MAIEEFLGKVVRLLWCDIPYVGFFLTIDNGQYIVLTDCKRYSNLTLCFNKTINTTNQQVDFICLPKTEIRWIATLLQEIVQVREEFINCVQRNFGSFFQIHHCLFCYKPMSMLPINQRGAAMYSLVGNHLVALPDTRQARLAFIRNLPNNCWRCAGGNLTTINGRNLNQPHPAVVPMQQNNFQIPQGSQLNNAHLMPGIPLGLDLDLPPMLPYLADNNYFPPPVLQGAFGNNVGINPFYNPESSLSPVAQAFSNNMNFDPGNFNMPNPICGNPSCTYPNNIEMEYLPPEQLPQSNNVGYALDDDLEDDEMENESNTEIESETTTEMESETDKEMESDSDNETDSQSDSEMDEEQDDEPNAEDDSENADPDAVIPNVRELPPELPPPTPPPTPAPPTPPPLTPPPTSHITK